MPSVIIHAHLLRTGVDWPVSALRAHRSDPGALPYGGEMAGEQLWTTGDIAQRLGISVQRARLLSRRSDFPDPVQEIPHFSLWRAYDVEFWLANGAPDREA